MEISQLSDIFLKTLDPNDETRLKAEESLNEISRDSRFVYALCSMISNSEVNDTFRLLSATTLKNHVKKIAKNDAAYNMSAVEEWNFLWKSIPELIVISNRLTGAQLIVSLSYLFDSYSNQERILGIVDDTVKLITSNDVKRVYTGFLIFNSMLKNYPIFNYLDSNDKLLFVEKLLSKMLEVGEELVSHDSEDAMDLMRLILKNIRTYVNMELVDISIFNPEILLRWCEVFVSVIGKKEDPTLSEDDLENSTISNAKKWAYKCINYFVRKSNDISDDSNATHDKKFFKDNYALELYKVVDKQVGLHISGVKLSKKVIQQILIFLTSCVYVKSTWMMIKTNYMDIISMFILPIVSFDDELDELWNSDPYGYVIENIEYSDSEYFRPRSAALKFLKVVTKQRYEQTFLNCMSCLTRMLRDESKKFDPESIKQRYGYYMMETVLMPLALNKNSKVKDEMEQFAISIILPDMKHSSPYIRQIACFVFSKMSDIKWSNEYNLFSIHDTIIENLFDNVIHVAVFASLALKSLLNNDIILTHMAPRVHEIVDRLQTLNNTMSLDEISDTIEIIAANLSNELMPHVLSLTKNLTDPILSSLPNYVFETPDDLSDSSDFNDSNYDIVTKIQSHFRIITTYTMSMRSNVEIVQAIYPYVSPVISFILEKNIAEVYEETFEIMDIILYCLKAVPSELWNFFPIVIDVISTDPSEYLQYASSLVENYINFGHEFIVHNNEYKLKIYNIVQEILTDTTRNTPNNAKFRACELIETFVYNMKECAEESIPFFVKLIISYINEVDGDKPTPLSHLCMVVIITMIYSNPQLTIMHIENFGATSVFFTKWFNALKDIKKCDDKKLSILAILGIISLPVEALPQSLAVQEIFRSLIGSLVQIFEDYPTALEEHNKEKQRASGQCNDEEEDDYDKDCSSSSLGGASDSDIYIDDSDEYPFDYDDDYFSDGQFGWDSEKFFEDLSHNAEIVKADPYTALKEALQSLNVTDRLNMYLSDAERMKLVNIIEIGEQVKSKVVY